MLEGVDVITRSPINNVEDPTSPKLEEKRYWREDLCANTRAGWHVRGRGRGVGGVFASHSQGTDGGGAKARAQGTRREIGGRGVREDAQEEGTKRRGEGGGGGREM